MPLTTYREARPWAVAIKEEILERRMPPWGAASGYGHFANDMSLTGREISLILSWADGGAPSGVLLADEDKQPVFIPPLSGWELGPPDATIAVAENQKIAADSPFRVERFEVNTGLKQARWIRALQFDPVRSPRHSLRRDLRRTEWQMARHVDAVEQGQRAARGLRRAAAGSREAHVGDWLSRRDGGLVGRRRAWPLLRGEAAGANRGVDRDHARADQRRRRQDRRALPRRDGDQDADDDRRDVAEAGSRGEIDRADGDSSRRQRRADAVGEQLSAPSGRRPTS